MVLNYLQYGQHWFSSLDVEKFIQDVGFGDNSAETSHAILGKQKDHIAPIAADNEAFIDSFLKAVAARAQAANERKATLFLMVFAPVTPEHDIVVDFDSGPKKNYKFLTVEKIRKAIRNAVGHEQLPVVLMTESPLTGGWMCHPSLFGTLPTHADGMLELIARSCGGAFADEFMNSFTTRSTPIITDEQRSKVPYEDMTPVGGQTPSLHAFQRAIHECLEFRLSPIGKRHLLYYEPSSDAWNMLGPREGYPLIRFWGEKLEAPDDIDIDMEGVDRFEFIGDAFGGTRESQVFHLKYLVSVEFETW